MIRRWILYLAALGGSVVFYAAYREWFAWLLLVGVVCLPPMALLMSLPAMLTMKPEVACPHHMTVGDVEKIGFRYTCPLPRTEVLGKFRVKNTLTGKVWTLKPGQTLPGEHCGRLICKGVRVRVCDYLGLFCFHTRKVRECSVTVRPKPISLEKMPNLDRYLAGAWRPKPGGGFAENHELRLYRPGDSLNQIHWKLTAKMGKLIVREAMVPVDRRILLTMVLRGSEEELDRSLGQLLWLSAELLRRGLYHQMRVLTGDGELSLPVRDEASMLEAMDRILSAPCAADGAVMEHQSAAWQYRIGGGQDEA